MRSTRFSSTPVDAGSAADRPRRVLYGRRSGPRLSPARRQLLDELLPAFVLELPVQGCLRPASLFGPIQRRFALEIGFGGGEHLAWQAINHPEIGFIGVEPYTNGVASLVAQIDAANLANVRILQDDARLLLAMLEPRSVHQIFVLFPDPWPKTRHHKRRIVNATTAELMVRALLPGGELRLASDDREYVRWMFAAMRQQPGLRWLADRPADWLRRPADWPATRYEEKAIAAGRAPAFLRFIKD